jgi:hypothetical protein
MIEIDQKSLGPSRAAAYNGGDQKGEAVLDAQTATTMSARR